MSELNLRRVNDEVFIALDRIVTVGSDAVTFVKAQALANDRKRARICAHRTSVDPLHEMLIAITPDSYIRPHRHRDKSESFHIVEGAVDVIVFDEAGGVSKIVALGAPNSERDFFYRLEPGVFHTLVIRTPILVVHEVTNGPFSPDQTEFATWAPADDQVSEAKDYMQRIAALNAP